jgi:hypothetical protein
MSGGGESVKVNPGEVEQTAQAVAGALAQAAQPGPVPTATGTSPIDGAALAASGTVISFVAGASADLAPRGAEVLGAADSALAGLGAADSDNATELQGVGEQAVTGEVRPPAGAVPAGLAQSTTPALASGLGEVEQALSSVTSAIGSPASSLSGMSPTSLLSGAPMSSLTGSHVPSHDGAVTPENTKPAPTSTQSQSAQLDTDFANKER